MTQKEIALKKLRLLGQFGRYENLLRSEPHPHIGDGPKERWGIARFMEGKFNEQYILLENFLTKVVELENLDAAKFLCVVDRAIRIRDAIVEMVQTNFVLDVRPRIGRPAHIEDVPMKAVNDLVPGIRATLSVFDAGYGGITEEEDAPEWVCREEVHRAMLAIANDVVTNVYWYPMRNPLAAFQIVQDLFECWLDMDGVLYKSMDARARKRKRAAEDAAAAEKKPKLVE